MKRLVITMSTRRQPPNVLARNHLFKTTIALPSTTIQNNFGQKITSSAARFLSTTTGSQQNENKNITKDNKISNGYVSPYEDFFTMIKKGKLSSGTDADDYTNFINPTRYLDCGIPENVLTFTMVSYPRLIQTPYVQPGEHKVSLKVKAHYLPFKTEKEWEIFHQIVRKRFDPRVKVLKLVSEQFASRIENKRHTVSMLNRIVFAVKRLAKEEDSNVLEEGTDVN